MRNFIPVTLALGLSLAALAACAPRMPDSAAGAGFGSEADAMRARELELAGGPATIERLAPPQALSSETLPPAQPGDPLRFPGSAATAQSGGTGDDIAAQTAAVLAASSSTGAAPAASAGTPSVVTADSGLSAENDFAAVSGTRTIEGDAALIESNRSQYQVVQPTAVPDRGDAAQPNIVAFALATSHPVGTRVYSRSGVNLAGKAERNCRTFSSADLAQIEFLSRGGPENDRAGLDPDGDGYACGWDPSRFRTAVRN
ncbi:hypothetical protein QO034_11135 [Sedimentitalea sp. JM2-8]|uniref:Excalibur calcium-binding domain-containing protein n=1 Tax=Sedimentitalea xiamensis TaxID=3050037 RepID=A0ABT7FEW8_9RHOB|nr:hypothetical protein [Sedimentitalea xiamensis]MDK3073667.1 hypothetical protein [Sedimentitalea xiamensis]